MTSLLMLVEDSRDPLEGTAREPTLIEHLAKSIVLITSFNVHSHFKR